MPSHEHEKEISLHDLFPEAVNAQAVPIKTGQEAIVDPTPARRCIIVASTDGQVLSELHLNNGDVAP